MTTLTYVIIDYKIKKLFLFLICRYYKLIFGMFLRVFYGKAEKKEETTDRNIELQEDLGKSITYLSVCVDFRHFQKKF